MTNKYKGTITRMSAWLLRGVWKREEEEVSLGVSLGLAGVAEYLSVDL